MKSFFTRMLLVSFKSRTAQTQPSTAPSSLINCTEPDLSAQLVYPPIKPKFMNESKTMAKTGAPVRLGPNLFRKKPIFINPSALAIKRMPKTQMTGNQIVKTNAYGLLTFQAHTMKSSDLSVQQIELTQSVESERDDFLLENLPDRDHRANMFRNISVISKDGTSNNDKAAVPVFSKFLKKKITGFTSLQKIQVNRSIIQTQVFPQQPQADISGSMTSDDNGQDPQIDQSRKSRPNTPPKSIHSKSIKSSLRTLNSKHRSIAISHLSQKRVRFSMMQSTSNKPKEKAY